MNRYHVRGAVLLCMIVSCLPGAVGQERPPAAGEIAPAPEPGSWRNQRRERMREFGAQAIGLLTDQLLAADGKPKLDFARINEVLASLLPTVLSGDTRLESLRLEFDPAHTDLSKDMLRLTADASLRRTAWSLESTTLHAELGAAADLAAPGGARADADARIVLRTAVVPLADFGLQRLKSQSSPSSTGPDAVPNVQQQIREYLRQVDQIASLDDAFDVYQHCSSLLFRDANEQVDRLKRQLRSVEDEPTRQRLAAELSSARLQRDRATNVRTRVVRDSAGHVERFSITLAPPEGAANPTGTAIGPVTLEGLEVVVAEREVSLAIAGRITKGVEVYALLKPMIFGTLERIQARDPVTLDAQRALFRKVLDRLQGILDMAGF